MGLKEKKKKLLIKKGKLGIKKGWIDMGKENKASVCMCVLLQCATAV